jgi:AcrR family transcriptional regulator
VSDAANDVLGDNELPRSLRAQVARTQRRAQLLESAREVFAQRGYHATSITDLVEAAGVARGTFYLYFESKHAIFLALVEDLLSELRGAVSGVRLGPDAQPIEDQLARILSRALTTIRDRRDLTRILFREAVGLDAEVDALLEAFWDQLHRWLAESVRSGSALGFLRDVEPETTASCVIGAVREVAWRHAVASATPLDADRHAAALIDVHLRGLRAAG